MDEILRRLREQQEIARRAMEGPAKYLRDHQAAISRMQDLVRRMDVAAASLVTPEFMKTLDRYTREQGQLHATIERLALPHRVWTREAAAMSSLIRATQVTLLTVDFGRVGHLIGAAQLQSATVARLTDKLLFRHADLIDSITHPDDPPAPVPATVSDLPSQDVFVHTSAVRSITPHEPLEDKNEQISVPLRTATTSLSTASGMRVISPTSPAPTLISLGRLSHRLLAQGGSSGTLMNTFVVAPTNRDLRSVALTRTKQGDPWRRPTSCVLSTAASVERSTILTLSPFMRYQIPDRLRNCGRRFLHGTGKQNVSERRRWCSRAGRMANSRVTNAVGSSWRERRWLYHSSGPPLRVSCWRRQFAYSMVDPPIRTSS